jgi:hypothetical protein
VRTSLPLLIFALLAAHAAPLHAQTSATNPAAGAASPAETTAAITLQSGERVDAISDRGLFERVGLRPNELITVVLQYPAAKAGRVIVASPLDGGRVIAPQRGLTVAADGTVEFRFQAGKEPGMYQISLRDAAEESGLEFWVLDANDPRRNPPVKNKLQ